MSDPMLPLFGPSSVSGTPVVVTFDGGLVSSDGCILALREIEQRLRVADRSRARTLGKFWSREIVDCAQITGSLSAGVKSPYRTWDASWRCCRLVPALIH